MAFALENAGMAKDEISRRVEKAAQMLELEALLDVKPANMSGGQRQRVSMGRAIVREPKVFLMDEPLSNLDARLRVSTRAQIAQLQRELGVTTVYVTHDQTEAMTMGDRVAVLKDGILQQCDEPMHLYRHPGNTFVAGFIGSPAIALFDTAPVTHGAQGARASISPAIEVEIPAELATKLTGNTVIAGVRPEHWDVAPASDADGEGIRATISHIEQLGAESFAYLTPVGELSANLRGKTIAVRLLGKHELEAGMQLLIKPTRLTFFDADSEINLEYL